nr:hypothetical protein [Tanacetum cinerariifolium]
EGSEDESNDEEDQELRLSEEARIQEEEEADELYRDVNINQGRGLQVTQNIKDSHVTLTPVHPDGPQESSSMSSFTPTPIMTPSTIATITTSRDAPIPPTIIPSIILENLPTFNSALRFDERLRSLETTFSEYRQTNPYVDAMSAIPDIVNQYMTQQMTEAIREAVQIQADWLQDLLQRENDEFLHNIDENMKKIIKGQVKSQDKEQVSRILPRIEESVNSTLEAKVLTRPSHSSRTSYAIAADLSEMELKKILIEKTEGNKSIQRLDEQRKLYKALVEAYDADKAMLDTYGEPTILKRRREDDDQEGPSAGSDSRSKRQKEGGEHASTSTPSETAIGSAGRSTTGSQSRQLSATAQGDAQSWITDLARQTDARSLFNKLLDTPIDFSNFIMNRLNVDTLTLELLACPTYELMRGSCTSLTELEYHLEEVYKATTDQLDWVNPEGQQYPHNLLQPLPLIPDNRGRRVIPFKHFINNDLKYLRGGASSRKYTTSVTKTKAADYGHIKWIEDLVPRAMWIQEPINYDRHALWEVSHWGRKCQQFYRFVVNRESALDVYSKRRIIAVTQLKIMKCDFKRLRLQDIEDILLLLEHCHPEASERSLTGSGKLPEEGQPYEARHVSNRSK